MATSTLQGETFVSRLWQRELDSYPDVRRRYGYLAVVVLTAVVLYDALYTQSAVSTAVMAHYGMSFKYFVGISVASNGIGAFASLAAGRTDRIGRANVVVIGTGLVALLMLLAVPGAPDKTLYLVAYVALGVVEGVVLVATAAMIRDFSPQVGRAGAMGFWLMGPVLGSVTVTEVASHTLGSSTWQDEMRYAGIAAAVVFVVALVFLRELGRGLRNQIMVSARDRALIEARARGIEAQAEGPAGDGHWRQMLRPGIAGPAFSIGAYLLLYYAAVGSFVVYFSTNYGYTAQRVNALATWYWISNAVALVVVGAVSDRLRVRKPFMIVGAAASIVFTILFAQTTTHQVGYYTLAWIFVGIGVSTGVTNGPFLAAFTESVEERNPAATATGLAVYGWLVRIVVAVFAILLPHVVTTATPLVTYGPQVAAAKAEAGPALAIVQAHPAVFAELAKYPAGQVPQAVLVQAAEEVGPANLALVQQDKAQLAVLQQYGPQVADALAHNADDWLRWWYICLAGQIVFVPFVFLLKGRWSPKKAREDADEHERRVAEELAAAEV